MLQFQFQSQMSRPSCFEFTTAILRVVHISLRSLHRMYVALVLLRHFPVLQIQLSPDNVNAVRVVDLLSGYELNIQLSVPTHQLGRLLDIVAACRDLTTPNVRSSTSGCLTTIYYSGRSHPPVIETVVRCPCRTLDIDGFRSALSSCQPHRQHRMDADAMTSRH